MGLVMCAVDRSEAGATVMDAAKARSALSAAWMATGNDDELFTRFSLDRFAKGAIEREGMIIG